jgi:hypothetical protein
MLSNVINITSLADKPPHHTRLWSAGLATLALFITAFPSFAASPQPQPPQPPQLPQSPNAVCPPDGQCFADVSASSPFYAFVNRIFQQDLVTGYPCGGFAEPCDPESRPYYRPNNNVTRQQMAKFIDNARRLPEIHIETISVNAPIYVSNTVGDAIYAEVSASTSAALHGKAYSADGQGVYGTNTSGDGVFGYSLGVNGTGVHGYSYSGDAIGGYSITGDGVQASSSSGRAVYGYSTGTGYGVYGSAPAPAQAGHFSGNVQITGNLSKGGGSFKVDHPLDPENKYLYHSFVESPDMMNVYNGNVILDAQGEAWVQMPEWFDALNKDFRYQLTAVGAPGPNLYIAQKIEGNRFKIAGGSPGLEVSWMVTGIRQDPYANAHRIPVEEEKPDNERGKYLHPTEWGQAESKGIDYEWLQQTNEKGPAKP